MPLIGLPADTDWPVPQLLDRDRLLVARSEDPFRETAVGLATEFGELTALLAQVRPAGEPARDAAILRGMSARIVKFTRALIAATFAGHGELQALYDRLLFETIVDLAYLLRGSASDFDAFARDGLRFDRELWDHLGRNRELRAGEELPMEQRTRAAIEAKLVIAGTSIDDVPLPGEASTWPSTEQRLQSIGEPDARAMHQLGAGSTHGIWHELITHHLVGDELEAKLSWSRPLVQPLFALPIQGGRVMAAYARHLGPDAARVFRDRYLDLVRRAADADLLHEEYMARADLIPPPEQ